ncbi:PQQ-binding-like beta-propeller repeat protein [Mycobacterium sp. E802]|uniref:PQQ-binding-like beta-propeller repeat protein n=1 Tax=Mycobacterium sp. E802 TaxID=1834152 RepID=UPI0012F82B3C|nr:PQQ-binding-like beta-propeller repeat protein [Mycobacterium sp. E802]
MGVAAYGALGTSSPYCSTAACDEAASTAVVVVWATAAVAAAVAALTMWRLLARARGSVWVRVAAVVGGVGVAVGYVVVGVGASDFAASGPRIWLVGVVVGATIVGCLLVGVPWLSLQSNRAGLATAAASGIAMIVVGVAAVAAPNEYDPVDATTAAPVDIPLEPEILGQEQFRLSVPYFRPRVDAAGAGFIVWTPYWAKDGSTPVLIAYDNAGAARWHYGRGPDQPMTRVRVYDDDTVVVVGFAGDDKRGRAPEVVGLDAVTGEQLWASHDLAMWNALDIDEGASFTSFVERGEESWKGFNARTGQQRWEIPNPAACGDGPLDTVSSLDEPYTVRIADIGSRLVTVNDCSTPDMIKLRVLAHDAVTGDQLGAWPVPGADGVPRNTWKYLSVDRSVGDSVSVSLEKECARRNVDRMTGQIVQQHVPALPGSDAWTVRSMPGAFLFQAH